MENHTDNEIEPQTFGRYLCTERLRKRIPIEAVAARTNIGQNILLLLEQENHEKLPDPVYVMGFLRAYAEAIGVSGDLVVARYRESREGYDKLLKGEVRGFGGGGGLWSRLLFPVFLVAAVICLTVWLMPTDRGEGPAVPPPAPKAAAEKAVPPAGEATPAVAKKPSEPPPAPLSGKKWLKVVCVSDSTLKVIADGGKPKVYDLKAGDRLELTAEKEFNLLIGNAAGLRLSLNGKPVPVPGKSDQMVNLKVP